MNALTRILLVLSLLIAPIIGSAQTKTYSTAPDFSRAELDQMLAPIALYPDTVLSHVLIATTYPLEVVQADRWARDNTQHTGQSAVNAVENEDWDPSVKALVAFPEILRHMSNDLDWTQRLGDAFLDDENEVMAVIQDLRQKAYASGSLKKMEYVRVQHDENVIVIEPTVERVVYIPYYDTRIVYGNWRWPEHPPVYWQYPRNHISIGVTYWGPRVSLGSGFFFSSFQWHRRHLVVIDHRHHHPGFSSGRHIAHYKDARRWRHNPHHRRGVDYRNDAIRHHYHSNRNNQRKLQEQRYGDDRISGSYRRVNTKNYPVQARDNQREQTQRPHHAQRVRDRLVENNGQSAPARQHSRRAEVNEQPGQLNSSPRNQMRSDRARDRDRPTVIRQREARNQHHQPLTPPAQGAVFDTPRQDQQRPANFQRPRQMTRGSERHDRNSRFRERQNPRAEAQPRANNVRSAPNNTRRNNYRAAPDQR